MVKKYFLLVFLFIQVSFVFSQSMDNTLFFLKNTPQSNKLNPAIMPDYDLWVGFPGLNSIYLNYGNNSFTINDLLHKEKYGDVDSVVVNVNSFQSALAKSNRISIQEEIGLLAGGFRIKRNYITFDFSQKSDVMFGFRKSLMDFVIDGNTKYLGQSLDIGHLKLNGSIYNQISLGIAREFGYHRNFIMGVKFKVLFGVANIKTQNSDVTVDISRDATSIKAVARHTILTSAPLETDDEGNVARDESGYVDFDKVNLDNDLMKRRFFSGIDNLGFGVDIGFQYKPNEDFRLSVSLLDIGYIKWKTHIREFSQGGEYEWKGDEWGQPKDPDSPGFKDFNDLVKDLVDSLGYKFEDKRIATSYKTSLSPKLYVGASYRLNDDLSLGALSMTQYYYGNIATSLTLSANGNISDNFTASVSYTAANNSYKNLGIGLSAKMGCMQLYMVTDNVLGAWIADTKMLNFRFGINLLFAHKDRKRSKKYKLREREQVRNFW